MEQLLDPELEFYLWPLIGGLGIALAWEAFKGLRVGFLRWRLQSRMARDPYLSSEEMRDYEWEIARFESDEEAIPWMDRLPRIFLEVSGFLACFALGRYFGWDLELVVVSAFGAFGIIAFIWERLNKPPDRGAIGMEASPSARSEVLVPDEAIWGGVAAAIVVGMILLLALVF